MICKRFLQRIVQGSCARPLSTSVPCLSSCEGFDIKDKAALVTGGASGIGYQCCKALLRSGARGVTIADKDKERGENALRDIAAEFGNDRAVFVQCDTTKCELVDWAFKTTLNAFNRLDIVVNNAGILNDKVWETEIKTNVCGTMVGNLLGLQYMAAHCVGSGGFVINIASTMGLAPFGGAPIYSMTQAAILGLTRALGTGAHIDRTNVKVIGIAAGLTDTPLMMNAIQQTINNRFGADLKKEIECHKWQRPEDVAGAMMQAIADGESGAIWVVESCSEPFKVAIPCYRSMFTEEEESIAKCDMPGVRSTPIVKQEKVPTASSSSKVTKEEARAMMAGKDLKAEPAKKTDAKKPPTIAGPPANLAGKDATTKKSETAKAPLKRVCGTCPQPSFLGKSLKKFGEPDKSGQGKDGKAKQMDPKQVAKPVTKAKEPAKAQPKTLPKAPASTVAKPVGKTETKKASKPDAKAGAKSITGSTDKSKDKAKKGKLLHPEEAKDKEKKSDNKKCDKYYLK